MLFGVPLRLTAPLVLKAAALTVPVNVGLAIGAPPRLASAAPAVLAPVPPLLTGSGVAMVLATHLVPSHDQATLPTVKTWPTVGELGKSMAI